MSSAFRIERVDAVAAAAANSASPLADATVKQVADSILRDMRIGEDVTVTAVDPADSDKIERAMLKLRTDGAVKLVRGGPPSVWRRLV